MLKTKKRPADKTTSNDEPDKKKSPKGKKPAEKASAFEKGSKKKSVTFSKEKDEVKKTPAVKQEKPEGAEKKFNGKPAGKSFAGKPGAGKFGGKPGGNKFGAKPGGNKFGDKKFGDKKFGDKKFGDKKFGDKKFGDKKFGDKKFGDKKFGDKKFGDKKFGDKKFGDKKSGDNKFGDKKSGDNKFADKKFGDKGAAPAQPEKTDWNKFKQDRKELKLKRKKTKDSYEISVEAKQIYEKLKCRRTEKKAELVEKLFNLFASGDTIKKIVMAHDTARILQCMLKFAAPSLRDQLSEKLLPYAVEMSVSKYSHFCVLRMFKYGSPTIKSKLVDAFQGHVVRLACHNISSKILDHVYLSVATAAQKALMRQEFYGDLYKKSKDAAVKCLQDTYKDSPNMKASMLSAVKANLEHVANKQLVDNSLVHAIMLEYLRECDEEKLEEAVTMYATHIPLMLTTKDGCQAAVLCFYKSTPKNRRAIIKTIKEHLVKICTHEHGHIFMLAVLNALDDTKATKKAIYDNIHPELETLMANQWGRRVIEWFISPGDTNSFHPSFIALMDEALQYGKKDKDLRRKEIFEQIEEPIAKAIEAKPEFYLNDKHIALVTAIIMKKLSPPNFVAAATALTALVAKPDWAVQIEDESKEKKPKKPQDVEKIIAVATKEKKLKNKKLLKKAEKEAGKEKEEGKDKEDGKEKEEGKEEENEDNEAEDEDEDEKKEAEEVATISVPGIEEAGMHIILKKIIKGDKERAEEGQTFGSLLVEKLTDETLTYWLTVNRACFVLLNIAENNNNEVSEKLKALLKPHRKLLMQQSSSGSKLLAKNLAL